ncbi:NUDIX domain-containing protein [Candidatus Woesearchaeota archaeon]|nr:NUDIX domain-containing protein [Candidatus Woesearchaeota archaeon]
MHEKSCGTILSRKRNGTNEFLLVQSSRSGRWGFPKGHVNMGESEVETAKRETHEEVGIRVEVLDGFREEITYPVSTKIRKTVVYFLAKAHSRSIHLDEEELREYAWLPYTIAKRRIDYTGLDIILDKANVVLQR